MGLVSVGLGIYDVTQTMAQYEKAQTDLAAAATEARAQGLTALADRLGRLSRVAARRRREGIAQAVGGPIWLVAGAAVDSTVGTAASRGASDLANEGVPPPTAGGTPRAAPDAPRPAPPPAMPAMPPRYVPPGERR
ncbi:MAG: hypothetical protein EOO24_16325 [Comamonadaceae bacterium]|nr:MAG: hypothetical protein EOO24_16325 [Comamonadaceae bacterium]